MKIHHPFLRLSLVVTLIIILFSQPTISTEDIPSSPRSIKVIQKMKPILEKELLAKSLKFGSPIFIRIFKESNELELWVKTEKEYKLFKIYKICYYSGGLAPKLKQGDCQGPEGFYKVKPNRLNPNSTFHLSFDIGYPNKYDRHYKRTGSAIMIHGSCVSIGCYAMTDKNIEEIYTLADAAFRGGQKYFQVHIFPFRMTEQNMQRHQNSKWIDFWRNLKQGYDSFEKSKFPPNVIVENGRYMFQ